ncbi:24590_t:CDS:2 [Cetraspora pellucida]|uniref:24590_t:CDS:1 n=1 Tax=Cetraspora pellucida TaxID=1433469 RepID=A0A9N9NPH1_9GLOM|nr:24590_t:CDS:2 [Cetraspora pellucida]
MEVPVHASKYRKNYGYKHIIDIVDGKLADLLAWIEKTGEEIFVGEQAGPPTKCDLTKLATDSFKLYREMRDCLNFRILQAMVKDGIYIYDEYGSLTIASKLNQISDMKGDIIRLLEFMMIIKTEVKNNVIVEYDNNSIQILKRKFDEITQTKPSPNKVVKK